MSPTLWCIRILRWVPKTYAFDRHLTDCAALEVIYRPFNGAEPLTFAHIFKLKPLPDFHPDIARWRDIEKRRSEIRIVP